jgi:DNA repair photolyase
MQISRTTIANVLTRSSGFLQTVCSHSVQPYCGCALGNSLCGAGCYVQHNGHLTRGREWGSFVEVRTNAADAYHEHYSAERAWAQRSRGRFGIFLSSSTEPFQPVEQKAGITRRILEAMITHPPDCLILQSHSHHVADYVELYQRLAAMFELRIHISIESDRDSLPGLPPSASSVVRRIEAARTLRLAGLRTVVTVSPLLPIDDPHRFFRELSDAADAVVIDHFIEGDGSPTGARTLRTRLPLAMLRVRPNSTTLEYRDAIVQIARRYFPGRVGQNIDGFAGRMLS